MAAKKRNAVATPGITEVLLNDLVEQRESTGNPINTKVAIVAELILKAHKKECK